MLRRTLPLVAALALPLAALAACGGDDSSDATTTVAATATTAPAAGADTTTAATTTDDSAPDDTPADTAASVTVTVATVTEDTAAGDGGDAACGGLSAADVSTAAGGVPFDVASDTSVDEDTSCVFTSATGTYGISVSSEGTATYLGGELDGLDEAAALAQLGEAQQLVLEDGATVNTITLAGHQVVTVAGTNATGGAPSGTAATVVDGTVTVVTADGSTLGADGAQLAAVAANVLTAAIG